MINKNVKKRKERKPLINISEDKHFIIYEKYFKLKKANLKKKSILCDNYIS